MLAMLAACGAPLTVIPVQIEAAQYDLRAVAQEKLRQATDAPILRMQEKISDEIESTNAAGEASAYLVRYELTYQLAESPPARISVEEVVPYWRMAEAGDEAQYLASRRARSAAVIRLRRQALRQMRYILSQQ